MTTEKDNGGADAISFPASRSAPVRTPGGFNELGATPLAGLLGLQGWQFNGHWWCSRCQGIWYGCTLEPECPRCGNRHG